ncbi:MAG: dephospho-CoA kinase [Pseudomonadota bacterium]
MAALGLTRALRVGLTGGIGSGKSTVAQCLRQHGAAVMDTDAISRDLTAPGGAAMDAVRTQFGAGAVNAQGGMDRARMRQRVLSDPEAKQRLEALLHPMIEAEAEAQAARSSAALQVFDVPLLVETGRWHARVDRVMVVDCEESTQVLRVAQRPGWTAVMAREVVRLQASRAARRAAADLVIHNDDLDLRALEIRVTAAVERLYQWACGTITPKSS